MKDDVYGSGAKNMILTMKYFFGSSTFKRELFENHYYSFHKEVSDYFQNRNDFLILDLKKGYGYKELCDFFRSAYLK